MSNDYMSMPVYEYNNATHETAEEPQPQVLHIAEETEQTPVRYRVLEYNEEIGTFRKHIAYDS